MMAPDKAFVIVNPTAGAHRVERLWPSIESCLRKLGLVFEARVTEYQGHAIALARDAADAGYHMLVSVGGDGTLNETINGLMASQAAHRVSVGVVSVGTGTDFVRTLGLPRSWESACRRLVQGQPRIVDVGEITYTGQTGEERRFFINVAGLGFDGEVANRTNRSSKRLGGTIPYFTNLVLTLVGYTNKDVTVHLDDETIPGRMNSVIVANGQWFGGGMWVAPNACPDDGIFDVLLIKDIDKLDLLQTMPRVYNGTHLTHPKLTLFRTCEVHVDAQQDMWLQADGEALGRAPVTFRVHPQAVRLVV